MPYDEGEQKWKFHVFNEDGVSTGMLFCQDSADRSWPSRPRSKHFGILYKVNDEVGISYLLLFRFNRAGFTNEDYCQILTPNRAVAWLNEEGHQIPDDLNDEPDNFPLPEAQQEIWDLLKNRMRTAKEIAQEVVGTPAVKADSIRKRIQALKRQGRRIENKRGCGYYRPDAPPQENTGNLQDSG